MSFHNYFDLQIREIYSWNNVVDRRDIYHHCSCSYQIDCCIAHRDTETFRLGALKLHAIVFGSLSILTREEIGFLRMESLTSKQTWTSDYSKLSTIDCMISIICTYDFSVIFFCDILFTKTLFFIHFP